MADTTHLATWLSAEQKQRFNALAKHHGLSGSAFLRRLVEVALQGTAPLDPFGATDWRCETRSNRIYVRLREEDRRILSRRAADRGMRAATYVSVLIRAHLRALPPLPKDELMSLKRAVSELGAIGRNLNQIAAAGNRGAGTGTLRREDLKAFLDVCTALRDSTKKVLKANLRSWMMGHAADA